MLRVALTTVIVLATGLSILFFTGPRVPVDTTITFDPASIGSDPQAWLAKWEENVPALRPDLASEIVWAYPNSRARTPLSIVYIHGFSASKGEIRPVPDMVAKAFGANLFYARLTGHGQDSAAMGRTSVNEWVNDYAAAIAIGRMIGEKVIVMGTSTGGSLATWGATQPSLSEDVAGLVLISPNYGIQSVGAPLLTMPWGETLARLVIGKERAVTPANEMHAKYWTTTYPVAALLPMAATAALARNAPVENVQVPALFIFSDSDRVVRPERTHAIADRWGAPHDMMVLQQSGDGGNHVIAGDAFSPQNNTLVAGRIEEWISSLPQ
jgi:alpha-beta hydrolase superfamily lysophospholipase